MIGLFFVIRGFFNDLCSWIRTHLNINFCNLFRTISFLIVIKAGTIAKCFQECAKMRISVAMYNVLHQIKYWFMICKQTLTFNVFEFWLRLREIKSKSEATVWVGVNFKRAKMNARKCLLATGRKMIFIF